MAGDPDIDPWDADVWTLEAMDIDPEEIARDEQDVADDQDEDLETYRERLLAPLRRLAERLRAEDRGLEDDPSDRMAACAGEGDGAEPAD